MRGVSYPFAFFRSACPAAVLAVRGDFLTETDFSGVSVDELPEPNSEEPSGFSVIGYPTSQKRDVGHPKLIDLLESEPEWVEPEVGDVWVGDGWRKQGTGEIVREGERRDEEAAS